MKPKSVSERGQALILIAFAAIALFGITGLAIDGSNKYSDRRHAQNAADAAALAGALAKANAETDGNDPATVSYKLLTQALKLAADNGYDDNLVTNNVEVYTCNEAGSSCGPYAGNRLYVQVIITSNLDTYFMRVFGINQTQNVVKAVALAGKGGKIANGASVVSMNPNPNCSGGGGSGGGSFDVGGNGEIHLTGGGMFVNSSASCGYSQTSCSVLLTMSSGAGISSAGSAINQACGSPVPQTTGAEQLIIPEEVYYPERPAECSMTTASVTDLGGGRYRIHPGYYTDFPQAGVIGPNKDIEMAPGVYCVDSDIHWTGSDFNSLDGTGGVTIYMTNGHQFDMTTQSLINLNASQTGSDYDGYLIILEGDPNTHPDCTINGGSHLEMNGTIFAPYCDITINGDNTTDSVLNAQIIGWDIKLNGGNVINIHYDPADNGKIKRRVGLMK